MQTAKDLLEPALVVSPDMAVEPLARLLLRANADGACVVQEGRLVGVVTVMDLLFKQRLVEPPAYVAVLDAIIPLTSQKRWEEQSRRIAGANAADIMSSPAITVTPDATIHKVATLMVDQHLTMVPVVEHGGLLGIVTKQGLLGASGIAGDLADGESES